MYKEEKEIYEFGAFRLDVAECSLERLDGLRNGSLPDKAFRTLCVLVRRSGHLVPKEELLNEVWPDSFVEENNLDKCIHLIRHTLGQNRHGERYIETVRKRGYRFVAEVKRVHCCTPDEIQAEPSIREAPAKEPVPMAHDGDAPEREAWSGRWILVFGLLGVVVLAVGAGLYALLPVAATKPSKVAILPMKPVNPEMGDALYELGMTEALINRLGTARGISVQPLSAVRSYTAIDSDPVAAGREQQVDYVLASNFQIADGKLRITAQLFNVASGKIEETFITEKALSTIFSLQDAVASEMGNRLMARFSVSPGRPASSPGTANEEAYRLYLQGMYFTSMRERTGARKAVEVLEKAVQLDPDYARAWAGKAHAHRAVANYGRSVNIREHYEKSIEAINKALALDPNLVDAYSALCENKLYYEYDFAGAERECRRAVDIDPNSALAHQIYSRYLASRGRFEEALSEARIAVDLDPASLYNQRNYGVMLQWARRYDDAVTQLKRVAAMREDFLTTYTFLSMTLGLMGREPEAFEWYLKLITLSQSRRQPAETGQVTGAETVQAFQEAYQKGGWMGVLRERARRFEQGDEVYFHGACYNALIGEKDRAFEYLERSYQRRELWMVYLQIDPRLDSLRDDPRYAEMVGRVESHSS